MKTLILSAVLVISALFSSSYSPPPDCEENINPDCFCILIYDPVCGCNNKTYGNACEAMCSGITDFKKGECKYKKPKKIKN